MWRALLFFLFFFTVTVLQSVLLNYLSFEFLKADLAVPFIVYGAFFGTPLFALLITVIFALVQEGMTSGIGGTLLFSKTALLLFAFFLRNRLYIESHYTFAAVCGISEVFQCLIILGLLVFTEGNMSGLPNLLINLLPVSTCTAFFSIPIYSILVRLDRKYGDTRWE